MAANKDPSLYLLIESTYAAFSEAPRPEFDQITGHRCRECDAVRDEFAKYQVRELPDAIVDYERGALPLLTPMALRYFLPRYIDSSAIDYVLYHLSAEHPHEPYWAERYAVFSDQERAAIANYIAERCTWPEAWVEAEHLERAKRIWGPGNRLEQVEPS
jgi:hypothetical protein